MALIVVAAALAGCGGSSSPSSSAAHHLPPPSHTYRVALAPPTTAKASGARGVAIIALHDAQADLCWRFAHLHGFTGARSAVVLAPGAVIHLSTSPKLRHQGCRHLSSGLLALIGHDPRRYTVTIPTASDPRGALSARL